MAATAERARACKSEAAVTIAKHTTFTFMLQQCNLYGTS